MCSRLSSSRAVTYAALHDAMNAGLRDLRGPGPDRDLCLRVANMGTLTPSDMEKWWRPSRRARGAGRRLSGRPGIPMRRTTSLRQLLTPRDGLPDGGARRALCAHRCRRPVRGNLGERPDVSASFGVREQQRAELVQVVAHVAFMAEAAEVPSSRRQHGLPATSTTCAGSSGSSSRSGWPAWSSRISSSPNHSFSSELQPLADMRSSAARSRPARTASRTRTSCWWPAGGADRGLGSQKPSSARRHTRRRRRRDPDPFPSRTRPRSSRSWRNGIAGPGGARLHKYWAHPHRRLPRPPRQPGDLGEPPAEIGHRGHAGNGAPPPRG